MAKWCPLINDKVLYTECVECEDKICRSDVGDMIDSHEGKNRQKQRPKKPRAGYSGRKGK